MYNCSENKLFFGKGRPNQFEGKEIKFYPDNKEEEVLRAKHIYLGQVEGYKFNKNGFYLDKN